jgi:hypothetical protein
VDLLIEDGCEGLELLDEVVGLGVLHGVGAVAQVEPLADVARGQLLGEPLDDLVDDAGQELALSPSYSTLLKVSLVVAPSPP